MTRATCERCKEVDVALADELVAVSEAANGPLSHQQYETLIGPCCLTCRPVAPPKATPSTEPDPTITVAEMQRHTMLAMSARIRDSLRH